MLALPFGTAYAIWLAGSALTEALAAGYSGSHTWGGGRVTDLAAELQDGGWLFGAWRPEQESDWLRRTYFELG